MGLEIRGGRVPVGARAEVDVASGARRRVVVEGESLRRIYDGLVDEGRLAVVPNFADDSLFVDPEQVAAKHRAGGPLRVLYLSNLFASKGYREVLAAAEEFERRGDSSVRFEVAGDFVDLREQAGDRDRMAALGNLDYLGVVDGVAKREALQRAHVLCLPTAYPYEGQPLCILEAYASGRGRIYLRGRVHVEQKKNREQIIIDEIPYQIVQNNLIEKIVDAAKSGRIPDISDVKNFSGKTHRTRRYSKVMKVQARASNVFIDTASANASIRRATIRGRVGWHKLTPDIKFILDLTRGGNI